MSVPLSLIDSLSNTAGFQREAFLQVHASAEQVTSVRINPAKPIPVESFAMAIQSIPWTTNGYYLAQRPSFTFDPLFHAGCYYVQEASSMFLEQAIKQSVDLSAPVRVLDLCGAPGGKSTHLQSLLSSDSLLVSNEVIRGRAHILKDNIIKWGSQNVIVTQNDPADFSTLENYFDVIVVDAPCSGSGLFRREPDAINEWSLNNVALCSQRQQRILADVWPALKKGGILIYSTCSYSREEDEEIMQWIVSGLDAESIPLQLNSEWNICETKTSDHAAGYRFWPDQVKGEGFFLACFRKSGGDERSSLKIKKKPEQLSGAELDFVTEWIPDKKLHYIKHLQTVYAWPAHHVYDFSALLNQLRVIYSGTIIGELMRNKLVPDHALAMSAEIPVMADPVSLDYSQAIQFLQRKDISIDTSPGWKRVFYEGKSLGWVNVLSNRINNYYPKELRILKDKSPS